MGGLRSWWGPSCLVLLLAACERGAAVVHADELVLEVGGARPSLRAELQSRGQTVGLPQRVRVEPVVPPPAPVPQPDPAPDPAPDPQPQVDPQPRPIPIPLPEPTPTPTPPAFKVVKLKKHQTLMHLSQEHLGTTRRWKEILALNGWSEAQANRLREGLDVKIPIGGAPTAPPR